MNHIPCLGTKGEATLKPVELFVVLMQADRIPRSLAKHRHWLCSCKLVALSASLSTSGPHGFRLWVFSPPFWSELEGTFHVGGAMTQHLAWLEKSQAQDPQNSRLRLQIRQVCATVGSPVSVCLHLCSIDEQSR